MIQVTEGDTDHLRLQVVEEDEALKVYYLKHIGSVGGDHSGFVMAASPRAAFDLWKESIFGGHLAKYLALIHNSDIVTVLEVPPLGDKPAVVERMDSTIFNVKTGELIAD